MFDISRLSALIFDLDGVIWRGNMPVPGAVESVARLRAAGKRCFYCTNNSRKAPADFVAALAGMGALAIIMARVTVITGGGTAMWATPRPTMADAT